MTIERRFWKMADCFSLTIIIGHLKTTAKFQMYFCTYSYLKVFDYSLYMYFIFTFVIEGFLTECRKLN